MAQTGLALYALYTTSVSAAAVVTLTLATFIFNLIELMIDGLWPPHRFRRHQLPHETVSRSSLAASHHADIEQGIPELHPMDMELMVDTQSIGASHVSTPERQITPPPATIAWLEDDDLPPTGLPSRPCPAYQRPVEVAP